jgi:hypothetical protein
MLVALQLYGSADDSGAVYQQQQAQQQQAAGEQLPGLTATAHGAYDAGWAAQCVSLLSAHASMYPAYSSAPLQVYCIAYC